jgi:hypothetical protein
LQWNLKYDLQYNIDRIAILTLLRLQITLDVSSNILQDTDFDIDILTSGDGVSGISCKVSFVRFSLEYNQISQFFRHAMTASLRNRNLGFSGSGFLILGGS